MINPRATALRASRISRISPSRLPTRNIRFQTSSASSAPGKSSSDPPTRGSTNRDAVIGGLVGGSLVFLGGYAYYHFSGAKTVVRTAKQAKSYFEDTLKKTKQVTPPPNEAIQWLKGTALSYAAVIPGGKRYVEVVFDDLETVHEKHRDEVDGIVKEAYDELKDLGNQAFNMGSVACAWDVLQKHMGKLADLAKDAGGDILNNHPQLKDRFGGEFDRLEQMGENYGPEAKKLVDQTWNRVQDALKSGFSFDTFGKVKSIVQETTQELQKMGDQAWQKAMEQAKPYLEKNPQLKELVEKNKTQLMQGNAMELAQKVKDAASSGKTEDLKKYVHDTVNKGNSMTGGGGGLENYFNMIPSGGSIWSNLSQLQEGAQKHGKEAEKLLKEAMAEVQQVLSKKAEEGKKLAEKAKQDTFE
jgi:hypothetical protein